MKKILAIISILIVMLPCFVLTGCKPDNEKRNLKDFYTNYLQIVENHDLLKQEVIPSRLQSSKTIYKVGFSYSTNLQKKLADSSSVYSYLDSYYNFMLDDAMAPVYLYASTMFNLNNSKFNKDDKARLYKKLDNLSLLYTETANRVHDLEATLNNNNANIENLQKLYTSYENLLQGACNLSIDISSLYFNKVLHDSNPEYSGTNQNTILNIANNTMARLIYYKTIYLDIYLNTQIIGNNVASKIINASSSNPFNISYTPYTSLKNINYTNRLDTDEIMIYATSILNLGISLHNIQLSFEDEFNKYNKAINSIIYVQANNSSELEDYSKKLLVDKFISENGIVYNSYYTLKSILDVCYNRT